MRNLINLPKNVPEFCYRFIRGCLYTFIFILGILGLTMIFFGFWYVYEGKSYHLDNSITFSVFAVSFVVGIVLFSLSACGLVGILQESLKLTKAFLLGMMILILIQFGTVFFVYAYKKQILANANEIFQDFVKNYADDDDVRLLVDTIQSDLKCCGISSPNDWDLNPYYNCDSVSSLACSVPPSCCRNFTLDRKANFNLFCGVGVRRNDTTNQLYQLSHIKGCKYAIYTFLEYKYKVTAGIFIGILVPQLIGILLVIIYILTLHCLIEIDLADMNLHMHRAKLIQHAASWTDSDYDAEKKKRNILFIHAQSMPNIFTLSSSSSSAANHGHSRSSTSSASSSSSDSLESKCLSTESSTVSEGTRQASSRLFIQFKQYDETIDSNNNNKSKIKIKSNSNNINQKKKSSNNKRKSADFVRFKLFGEVINKANLKLKPSELISRY